MRDTVNKLFYKANSQVPVLQWNLLKNNGEYSTCIFFLETFKDKIVDEDNFSSTIFELLETLDNSNILIATEMINKLKIKE